MAPKHTKTARRAEPAIAANVRAEMARAGMSPAGLAARAGLTVHQLRRRLRGDATISAGEVHALAQALKVPPTQLLDYQGPAITTREATR